MRDLFSTEHAGTAFFLLHITLCLSGCAGTGVKNEPRESITPQQELSILDKDAARSSDVTDLLEYRIRREMNFDAVGSKSYYIDKYRISEFRAGDYFAFKNQNPLTGMNSGDAGQICSSMGKRLCSVMEWKRSCLSSTSTVRAAESPGILMEDLSENIYEWVNSDTLNRSMAMIVRSGNQDNCNSTLYFSDNYKSSRIGFRCCRDAE